MTRTGATVLLLTLATTAQAGSPAIGACAVLPADNIWNTPVDQLPLDANSATYVATIGSGTTVHADFGSGTYNGGPIGIPFVTVPGTQTKYSSTFLYADESDAGPYAVPLNAPIEGGSTSNGNFRGYISEVMIFDRELTPDERATVSTNYLYKRYTLP